MTVRALLICCILPGVALNVAWGQAGAAVAELPTINRAPANGAAAGAANPYAMNPYSGAPAAAYPAAQPVQPGYAPIAPAVSFPASAADRDKPLGIGDQLTFQIVEDRDEPVAKRVLDTGELDIPYIGRVPASGKTTDQVAADIKRRLESEYYYKATVRLGLDMVSPRSVGRVYLSGLVRLPGPQELPPGERTTVSAVILKAGGFAQFANDKRVKVTRKDSSGSPETFTVNVHSILKDGRLDEDRVVRDGDYIHVPQKILNIGY